VDDIAARLTARTAERAAVMPSHILPKNLSSIRYTATTPDHACAPSGAE
jgi:hypothetical protein